MTKNRKTQDTTPATDATELRTADLGEVAGGNPFFILGALAYVLAGDTRTEEK